MRGAEVVLGLQRVRDGYAQLHFLKDRDGDLPIGDRWGLLFDREQGFRRDPDDGKPSTREQLAELRSADPALTQAQAAEAIGVSERTIRTYWNEPSEAQITVDTTRQPEGNRKVTGNPQPSTGSRKRQVRIHTFLPVHRQLGGSKPANRQPAENRQRLTGKHHPRALVARVLVSYQSLKRGFRDWRSP